MFWVIPAYSVPNVIFTFLMIAYGGKFSFTSRIVFSFLTTGVIVGLVPFLATKLGDTRSDETISYDLIMLICAFIGFSAAVLQATTIGFTNLLPAKYTQANIAGQSVAGILACLVRILTKAFEPNDSHGYISGGWFYFIAGAIGNVVCAMAFVYVTKTVFVNHHLKGYMSRKKTITTKSGRKLPVREKTQMILKFVADEEEFGDEIKAESVPSPDSSSSVSVVNLNDNISMLSKTASSNYTDTNASLGPAADASLGISFQEAKISSEREQMIVNKTNSGSSSNSISINNNSNNNSNINIIANDKKHGPKKLKKKTYHLTTAHDHLHGAIEKPQFQIVWKKVQNPAIALFLMFSITFLIFPGLITGIDSQYSKISNGKWMPVILVTSFNIFDYIGRQFVASWTSFGFNENNLWVACAARILLYPLFIVLYKGYIVNDIITHIAVVVFAVTNGHFCCLSFIYAPKLVKQYEQETCAAIMSSALVSGIFVGSSIALVVTQGIFKDYFHQ